MSQILPDSDPHGQINVEDVLSPAEIEDDAALKLVVQDAESAESWVSTNWFTVRWSEADIAYQSPPVTKVWEGTSVPRANNKRFTVATHVNALLAQIKQALFYDSPPFTLRARPKSTQDAVRAITTVQSVQLDEMKFPQEVKRGLFAALLFGTGIWRWGWRTYTKVEKRYKRKAPPLEIDVLGKKMVLPTKKSQQFEVVEEEKVINEPIFEYVDNRYCLVDPGCRTGDIRDAKFVVFKSAMTYRDLCRLRDEQDLLEDGGGYQLPSEDEIRSWFEPPAATDQVGGADSVLVYPGTGPYVHHAAPRFQKTTADPLDEPLEILERVDNDKIITVINKAKVIRNTRNPFGCINYFNVNWWDINDAFWGMGLGLLLASEQYLQQGLTNAGIDLASLIANPQIVRARGANVSTQAIRQRLGGIIEVDGDTKSALSYMEVPRIPPEIFALGQQSEARSEAVSGANELLTMGNMPAQGRTSIGRTATGASALSSAAASRIGSFVEDFCENVFAPWLWKMHEMNCERLPVEQLHEILNDELGEAFKEEEFEDEDYFNCPIKKFEVLAGSKLAVRQQMAQAVTLMMQLFESPQTMQQLAQINGEYVDVKELMKMIADASGFGLGAIYSIIKPLTAQMEQRLQAMNPAVIQAKGKAALQQQQHQHEEGIIEQKDIDRAVILALRNGMEKSMEPEVVTGAPGGVGFGSQEEG